MSFVSSTLAQFYSYRKPSCACTGRVCVLFGTVYKTSKRVRGGVSNHDSELENTTQPPIE